MRNLPTELLRTFNVVNEVGGFTQAGEILGRSQPAISLQIRRLEELLDVQLFDRRNGLHLTDDGQLLMGYAKKILELNDAVVARLRLPAINGLVRLGIPNDLEVSFLAITLSRFSQTYPSVTLKVNSDLSANLLRDYKQGKYDLVMALEEAQTEEGQLIESILEPLVWVHSPNFAHPHNSPVPLIVHPTGCLYRKLIIAALTKANVNWRIIYRTSSLMGIYSALKAGLGISALTRSTAPQDLVSSRELLSLPALNAVNMGFCYSEETMNSATRVLLGYLREGLNKL